MALAGAVSTVPNAWAAVALSAYIKASNTEAGDHFGRSVIGADYEASSATGLNGNQTDNSAIESGAAYVFTGFCPPCPQLTLVSDGSGSYFLRFTGAPDVTYRLQRATTLDAPWDTLATLTAPASDLLECHDTTPPRAQAFYRTVQP